MPKTQYELQRDQNIKKVQDVFMSLGIPMLSKTVRNAFSKCEKEGKGKSLVSGKPDSDNEYDPSSDIDNKSDSDDDYDDDLITEVR